LSGNGDYPTIAINAKIEALSGLGRNQEALALASEAIQRASNYYLAGHIYELYQARAGVYGRMGQWDRAADDYSRTIQYAKQLSYWRGVTQASPSTACQRKAIILSGFALMR
jgi:tetratricopeptide (TPR) repeat protein